MKTFPLEATLSIYIAKNLQNYFIDKDWGKHIRHTLDFNLLRAALKKSIF